MYERTKSAFLPKACTYRVCRLCASSIIGLSPSSCSGSVDPWPVEYQSCDLNNIVVHKQRFGVAFRIVATFARFFSFLILTSSFSNLFPVPRIYRVSLLYWLPINPSPNSPFLKHSMLSCSGIDVSDFEVLFPICTTESRTVSFLGTKTISQGSLIGQTIGQMFPCFSKIQLILIQQVNALLRQSHSEANSVFRLPSNKGLIRRYRIIHV